FHRRDSNFSLLRARTAPFGIRERIEKLPCRGWVDVVEQVFEISLPGLLILEPAQIGRGGEHADRCLQYKPSLARAQPILTLEVHEQLAGRSGRLNDVQEPLILGGIFESCLEQCRQLPYL